MKQMNCKKCRHCVLISGTGTVTCNAFLDKDDKVKTLDFRPYACMFFESKKMIKRRNKEEQLEMNKLLKGYSK